MLKNVNIQKNGGKILLSTNSKYQTYHHHQINMIAKKT